MTSLNLNYFLIPYTVTMGSGLLKHKNIRRGTYIQSITMTFQPIKLIKVFCFVDFFGFWFLFFLHLD